MKYLFSNYVFPYGWETVAQTLWLRYPNSFSTHVLSEDTLDRWVENGRLFSRRLLVKTNSAPKWAERFIPAKRTVNIIEESVVDPVAQTVVTYTRNVGYAHVLSIVERVAYRPSQDSKSATVLDRSAWISSGVRGFAFAIEKFGAERFKSNTKKANAGYLEAIERHFGHGDSVTATPSLTFSSSKEKLKTKAKELKELARSKAEPMYAAACQHQEKAA